MWRIMILIVLVISLALPSLADAQFSGCHGRVHLSVPALEVKNDPAGIRVLYLWAGEGFDIWERIEATPGHWLYRISFANTPSDPAIYWVVGDVVVLETPLECEAVFSGS